MKVFPLLGVISSLFIGSIPSRFSNSERYLLSDLQSIFFEYPGYQIGDRFKRTAPYNCNCVYLLKNGQIEGDAEYDENGIVKVTFYREDANVRTRHYAENKKSVCRIAPPDGFTDTGILPISDTTLNYQTMYGSSWGTISSVPEYYQDYYQSDYSKRYDAYCGPTSVLEYLSYYDRYSSILSRLFPGELPLKHDDDRALISYHINEIANDIVITNPFNGEPTTTYMGIQKIGAYILKAGVSNIKVSFTNDFSSITWLLNNCQVGIVHEGPNMFDGHYMLGFGYHTNERGVSYIECRSSYSTEPGIVMTRMDSVNNSVSSEDPSNPNWHLIRFTYAVYN